MTIDSTVPQNMLLSSARPASPAAAVHEESRKRTVPEITVADTTWGIGQPTENPVTTTDATCALGTKTDNTKHMSQRRALGGNATDREFAVFPYVIHDLECEIGKLKREAEINKNEIQALRLRLSDYEDLGEDVVYTVYWKPDPHAAHSFFTSRFFLRDARLQAELCWTQNRDVFLDMSVYIWYNDASMWRLIESQCRNANGDVVYERGD